MSNNFNTNSMTQEEFNEMLITALKENLKVECNNDGVHINVRIYFDDEEICDESCESECY